MYMLPIGNYLEDLQTVRQQQGKNDQNASFGNRGNWETIGKPQVY